MKSHGPRTDSFVKIRASLVDNRESTDERNAETTGCWREKGRTRKVEHHVTETHNKSYLQCREKN